MDWSWWQNIWRERAKDWTLARLEANQVPDQLEHKPIQAGTAYLNVFLRSMRVVDVRRGLTRFYGTVHSFISLPSIATQDVAKFHVLTTPGELENIDAAHIDRVIVRDIRLLGPIPYLGGDVGIEIGLFSIASVDLAKPFLNVLEKLSSAAGLSFVNVARPFVDPLLEGVRLLTDTHESAILEIGLSKLFAVPETGYFLIMRANVKEVDTSSLKVTKDNGVVDAMGQQIADYPYLLLCFEASPTRDDWFQIPELKDAYKKLQEAVKTRQEVATKEAWAVFETTALLCPDLLPDDQDKLIEKARAQVERVLGHILPEKPGVTIQALDSTKSMDLPDLEKLNLYGI